MKKSFTSFFILVSSFVFSQTPNFQWVKSFQGNGVYAHSVARDAANNVYAFGEFSNSQDFNPYPGPLFPWNMTAIGSGSVINLDAFVVKYDPSGLFGWATQIHVGDNDNAFAFSADGVGNTYAAGRFQNWVPITTNYNIFVSKLNSSGSVIWSQPINGPGSSPNCYGIALGIDSDPLGNVYVAGSFNDTLGFDPVGTNTLASSPGGDGFILKLNINGMFLWAKQIADVTGSSSSWTDIRSIVADNLGDVYYTGFTYDTVDFDPGPGTFTMSPGAFVSKLNSAGNFVWAKQIIGAGGTALEMDNTSNIYFTGSFAGTADFDMGAGTFTLNASLGNAFISKIDPSGNFIWAKQFNGTT